jgi:hypothetical protein
LWKIARLNLQMPVTIVLDNARYQKCIIVKELACNPRQYFFIEAQR